MQVKVKNIVTEFQLKLIKTYYPHVKVISSGKRKPHPHICLYIGRAIGEKKFFKQYNNKIVVDVGCSRRNFFRKNVHGMESSRLPHILTKFQGVKEEFRTPFDNKHTFCRCRFTGDRCTHLSFQPDVALCTHSIYYNTPEEVLNMVEGTTTKTLVAIHHVFPNASGRFFSTDVVRPSKGSTTTVTKPPEARYLVKGDNVIMHARGNDQTYAHPHSRWILNPNRMYDGGYRVDRNRYLIWSTHYLDTQNTVAYTTFTTTDRIEVPSVPYGTKYTYVDHTRISEVVDKDLGKKLKVLMPKSRVWIGSDVLVTNSGKTTIPLKLIGRAMNFMVGKQINQKSITGLYGELRRLNRSKNFEVGMSQNDAAQVLPKIVNCVIQSTVDAFHETKGFLDYRNHKKVQDYNKHVHYEVWRFKWWEFIAPLLVFSICLFLVLSYPLNIYVLIGGMLGMIGSSWWLAPLLMTYASCGDGDITMVPLWVTILLLVLLFILIRLVKKQLNKYRAWKLFKTEVETVRRTLDVEGPIPEGAGLVEQDTWYTVEEARQKFPQRDGVRVKWNNRQYEAKEKNGVVVAGPVYNWAAPQVFKVSRLNTTISLISRVFRETNNKPTKYLRNVACMDNEYQISECNGQTISYVTEFTIGDQVFEHPGVITFEKYVNRFPKGKRNRIIRELEKFSRGESYDVHLIYEMFIKKEKQMVISREEYSLVKPRAIQGVSWLSKALAGPWFLNYTYSMKFNFNPYNWLWYCSGYTTEVFNFWVNYTVEQLGGHENVEIVYSDFSTYDISQQVLHTERSNSFYRKLGFEKNVKMGKAILTSKMKTRGYSDACSYTFDGMKKSGDHDTSTDNTKNSLENHGSFFKTCNIECRIAALGDDVIAFVSVKSRRKIFKTLKNLSEALEQHSASNGYDLKVLYTENIVEAEFLSMKFFPVGNKYMVGKKPGRVLSKMGYMMNRFPRTQLELTELFKGTLISYKATSWHVPFLRVYLQECLSYLSKYKAKFSETSEYLLQGNTYCDPTVETWTAFEAFYGLNVEDENIFRTDLRSKLKKHGLLYLHSSTYVEMMYELEQVL
jgi:hypothetical protein